MAGVAISVAPAETEQGLFADPRAEVAEAYRKIFMNGLRQFSQAWDERDGVSNRFNKHSALAVIRHRGQAAAANTFVVVSNDISDVEGGDVFQRFQRTPTG